MPICNVLNLFAIWYNGLNSIGINIVNAIKSPNDAVCSTTVFKPPIQITPPMVKEDTNSAIGKKIELYHTVFNHPFLWRSLMALNFLYSVASRVNNCKIFIPVTRSCTNEFKFETSVRTSSKARFM